MDVRGQALILATVRDISDRKQLEQRLRESEERYKLLFDKSPLPKWVFELETFRLLEVNNAAVAHYGYTRADFGQMTLADIRTPDEFAKLQEWVRICCTQGQKFEGQVQTKHRKRSGEIIDADVRYTEVFYMGRRAGLAVVIDITERKKAEDAIKRSRTLLAEAEKLSHTGAWEWDVLADRWTFSDEWLRIHGTKKGSLSPEELIGIAHADDRTMIQKAFEDVRAGVKPYEIEHRIIRQNTGEVRVVRARGQFVRDPGGDVVRVYGFVQDITEQKRAEQERERLIPELQRSNNELQQFAYVASHDLQEPLRTVASFSELLAQRYKGKLDATADRYISFIVDGANRMSLLINDLLAFSRVGTRSSLPQRVSMEAVVDRALADLRRAVRESGTAVTRERLPEVVGDETRLKQLMQNLLANAIKFRKKDQRPEIRISADRKENQWVFAVQDNGIGIEPRFFERIFTIFRRLHTREEYAGTGVGLAICRRIVERHGGRIWVESKPGEGATFYFTLRAA
jgi:PAS domain S-box-containing protein